MSRLRAFEFNYLDTILKLCYYWYLSPDLECKKQKEERAMREGYTIGQLASYSGVTVDTVRVYERQGLIEIPRRRSNGYRHYTKEYIRRINFIKWVQALGFTLNEIKELSSLPRLSTHACKEIRDRLESKLNIIEKKRKDLLRLKRSLESVIQICDMSQGKHCPVLEALKPIDQDT